MDTGFPVKETWIDAIKAGNYTTWPGLNVKVVNRYFPESDETQKGHMKKQRQNVRSTKVKETLNQEKDDSPQSPKKKEHDVYLFESSTQKRRCTLTKLDVFRQIRAMETNTLWC
jgi:hypothetical protein